MAEKTGISWTDSTWSPLLGCSPTSPGCGTAAGGDCYAKRDVWRMAHNPNAKISAPRQGLVEKRGGRLHWTGRISFLHEQLTVPIHWRKPRRIFVANQSDLFHESVPFEFIDRVWGVMAACRHTVGDGGPGHTFQVLTKRADRMREYLSTDRRRAWAYAGARLGGGECGDGMYDQIDFGPRALPNVWLGVSVENQQAAVNRIPDLLATEAALRFLSCEPLLDSLDLERTCHPWGADGASAQMLSRIAWCIAGGESHMNPERARPCDPEWIRSIVKQCAAAGIPCWVKQLGTAWARSPRTNEAYFLGGGNRAGADPEEWPAALRVQQMPEVAR